MTFLATLAAVRRTTPKATALRAAAATYSTTGPAASRRAAASFLTLSFSGAGHLLSYHLGVAASLHRASGTNNHGSTCSGSGNGRRGKTELMPAIRAVSGSSSGAIAATVFVRLPHRIEEYADAFLAEGGRAFAILKEMLHDEERRLVAAATDAGDGGVEASNASRVEVLSPDQPAHHNTRRLNVSTPRRRSGSAVPPSLHVATTSCETGQLRMFDFRPVHAEFRTISASWTNDELLEAVEASCRIPQSFHPADVLESPLSGGALGALFGGGGGRGSASTYPDGDGICIDDNCYVDGGIAAPAPPTPLDTFENAIRVVISPISGGPMKDNGRSRFADDELLQRKQSHRISPSDGTRRLLPFDLRLRGGLSVFPTVQNLRALGISAGVASRDDLMRWYDAGREDGEVFLNDLRL